MSKRKLVALAATALAGALTLSACTPTTPSGNNSAAPAEQIAQVAWNQGFYSVNSATRTGNAAANNIVLYMTNDQFTYYDKDMKLAPNKSFGSYELVSEDPLTVKQTLAATATWSDGVPVTPADLVLAWGAQSTHFNTKKSADLEIDAETKEITGGLTDEDVFFDSASPAMTSIGSFAVDGASVTWNYPSLFIDWEVAQVQVGLPAHIVGKRALGIADPTEAAAAVLKAFEDKDNPSLAKIAKVWNTDYNFRDLPSDPELLIGTGPYTITDLVKDSYTTVSRNANYKGERVPSIDKITVRIIGDPTASVQALENGDVLITQPQATAEILDKMNELTSKGVTVSSGVGATYEHVDMAMNNGGPFDPATYGGDAAKAKLVRQAFLHTIPRQKIIDTIVSKVNPDAAIRNSYTQTPGAATYEPMAAANGMMDVYGEGQEIDKAKDLLTQAGVTGPVVVRFMTDSNNTRRMQEFQLIKEAAELAGFQIEDATRTDWGDKLADTSVYDAALFGWQSQSIAVGESDANFRTGGQNNFYGYSNAEVDSLFDQLKGEVDPAKQQEILQQVEKILVSDAFGITIFQFPAPMAVSNRLSNVSSIAIAPTFFWNFWEWKLS